jgi:hypothetical protein
MLKILQRPNLGSQSFFYPDTIELFYKNKSIQPINWPYHTKTITYTLNRYGYRAPEFDKIEWSSSILVFGCSKVFGIGVDDSEHISSKLSQLLDNRVINMGISGASSMHMWALTTQLIEEDINPKACIYIWPSPNRVALFEAKNEYRCLGPWTIPDLYNLGPWMIDGHGEVYSNLAKISVTQQWPAKVKVLHYTWDRYAINNKDDFNGPLLERLDFGRDLSHPGPITFDNWAQAINKGLM